MRFSSVRFTRALTLIGAVGLMFILGCNPATRAYCEMGGECDDFAGLLLDPVPGSSDDSVDVCTVNADTTLSALRANSEAICSEMATALEAFMICVGEEGCDAFDITENECKDEWEDYQDLRGDADNRCNE
jgi:hypothetical protein